MESLIKDTCGHIIDLFDLKHVYDLYTYNTVLVKHSLWLLIIVLNEPGIINFIKSTVSIEITADYIICTSETKTQTYSVYS